MYKYCILRNNMSRLGNPIGFTLFWIIQNMRHVCLLQGKPDMLEKELSWGWEHGEEHVITVLGDKCVVGNRWNLLNQPNIGGKCLHQQIWNTAFYFTPFTIKLMNSSLPLGQYSQEIYRCPMPINPQNCTVGKGLRICPHAANICLKSSLILL